jgi:outer membrane lipoprotein-sorting protein
MFITAFGFAQDYKPLANASAFVAAYQKAAESHETLSATYVQNKHLSYMNKPIQSDGIFYASGQDKIRWEEVKPNSNILIMNGEMAYVVKDGETEAFDLSKNRQFSMINEMMSSVLSGDLADNEDFEITFFESASGYKVHLVPEKKMVRKFVAMVELVVAKNTYFLDNMTMSEADGNSTEILFSNQKANLPLEMTIFEPTN